MCRALLKLCVGACVCNRSRVFQAKRTTTGVGILYLGSFSASLLQKRAFWMARDPVLRLS